MMRASRQVLPDVQHGTPAAYRAGCHCQRCRDAWRIYVNARAGLSDPFYANPGAVIAVRIADLWAERDRARMAELNVLIRATTRCRFCDRRIPEVPTEHPGVCGRRSCLRLLRCSTAGVG